MNSKQNMTGGELQLSNSCNNYFNDSAAKRGLKIK